MYQIGNKGFPVVLMSPTYAKIGYYPMMDIICSSFEYTDYLDIQQELNLKLMDRFKKEGIEFAYPTQTVYVAKS